MQKYVVKKSLIDTLHQMGIGKDIVIPRKDFKIQSIRNAVKKLEKRYGYSYEVTERGMVDECVVTRLN